MGSTPYTYNLTPPDGSDEGDAVLRQPMGAVRENWEAGKDKRVEVLSSGPTLRDVDAAADCRCSCHPRPADTQLHGGGESCPCQLTKEQRETAVEEFFANLDGSMSLRSPEEHEKFLSDLSETLDADIWEAGGGAPYVVRGVVDGRFFYLRERHDMWRVEIAPDNNPLLDIWVNTLPREANRIVVAEGTVSTLYNDDEANPVRVAVEAVRLFLARRECDHEGALRFCPHCGIEAVDKADNGGA